jgi:2-phosphosulfolactate phosphatase
VRVEVSFVPAALPEPEGRVCIVVDALRATSTLTTMFARGMESVLVVKSLADARREAARREGWLLCGEKRSLPLKGFDYGNSPAEFSALKLRGKSAVFVTTNGTRALMRAAKCGAVFAGAMLNVRAVAAAAGGEARRRREGVLVQCAGDHGGRAFNIEDALTAGAIVDVLLRDELGDLNDEAETAVRLWRSYRGNARRAFREARHGVGLTKIGLGADVAFCAQRDLYSAVPRVVDTNGGVLLKSTR